MGEGKLCLDYLLLSSSPYIFLQGHRFRNSPIQCEQELIAILLVQLDLRSHGLREQLLQALSNRFLASYERKVWRAL